MIKWIYFKTDFKRLLREPVMALLFLVPLLIPVLLQMVVEYLIPFAQAYVAFDITPYHSYFLSFTLIIVPSLLGIVMGFMLLDDKDGHIAELMSVTPLGINQYLAIRLGFVSAFTFVYVIYSYYIFGMMLIPFWTLLFLAVLLSVHGAALGLLLFLVADDKVKGLTYAKGLNLVILFAFADLLKLNWVRGLAMAFPPYWITRIIMHPGQVTALAAGAAAHLIWIVVLILFFKRSLGRR